MVADCRLNGRRTLPNQAEPQVTTHFTARVRLTQAAPVAIDLRPPAVRLPRMVDGPAVEAAGIYRSLLPRARLPGCGAGVVRRRADRRPTRGQLARQSPSAGAPADDGAAVDRTVLSDRRAVGNRRARPHGSAAASGPRLRVGYAGRGEGPLFAVVTPGPDGGSFDADVVDSAGRCYVRVSGYRTVTFREHVAAEAFEALRHGSAMMAMADD